MRTQTYKQVRSVQEVSCIRGTPETGQKHEGKHGPSLPGELLGGSKAVKGRACAKAQGCEKGGGEECRREGRVRPETLQSLT